MKAALLDALGQLPKAGEFDVPTAGPGEILVRVTAAALKPLDRAIAGGRHYIRPTTFPLVAGMDGVGRTPEGHRIFFLWPRAPYGAMAEYTVVSATHCYHLPDDVPDQVAAALVNPGLAAWLPLVWRAGLQPKERVLIQGATGSAGTLAVQLAKLMGAGRIVVTGRNEAALASLVAMGADRAIPLTQSQEALVNAFSDEDFDVVIDYLWGAPTQAYLASLAQKMHQASMHRVRLVEVGASAGPTLTLPAELMRGKGLEISGTGFGTNPKNQERAAFDALMAHAARGELTIDTEAVPLSRVHEAWASSDERRRYVILVQS